MTTIGVDDTRWSGMAMRPGMPAIVVGWMSPAGATLDRVVVVNTPGSVTCAIAVPAANTRTKAVAASARAAPTAMVHLKSFFCSPHTRALLPSALLPMARALEQGDDSREICRQSCAHIVTSDDI